MTRIGLCLVWSSLVLELLLVFFLGVDVRTETNHRNEYPTIWLWNKTNKTDTYIPDKSVQVLLGPSNFSTEGVFQFSLSTPLQFTGNQVLGIYQPDDDDSVVRFYNQEYNGQDIYETDSNSYGYYQLIINCLHPHLAHTSLARMGACMHAPRPAARAGI